MLDVNKYFICILFGINDLRLVEVHIGCLNWKLMKMNKLIEFIKIKGNLGISLLFL